MSQCFGCELWREGSFRGSCAGLSEVTVFWWLGLEKAVVGSLCVGGRQVTTGTLVARFGQEDVPGRLRS